MQAHYGTIEETTTAFMDRHRPQKNQFKKACCKLSPALMARLFFRTALPVLFGIAAGMLTELVERKLEKHNDNLLLEFSDFSACVTTLVTAHILNALLDCCWPSSPYISEDFSQFSASSHHTNATAMELRSECVTHRL